MFLKKVELHVHLEGTISPHLALKLAQRNKVNLPPQLISADKMHYIHKDFTDFLSVYDTVAFLIKSPQDYYDVTFEYLKASALEGCIYTEMMYSPDHAERATKIPSVEHLKAIQQAITDAKAKYGIIGTIIITAVRHFGQEASILVAKNAKIGDFPCVTGFGLGGDEEHYPPQLFIEPYKIAAENGLYCTVHAGEFGSAQSMLTAINKLPITRIGHGVNAITDPHVMQVLKDKQIALELCPSSNIIFGLFKSIDEHPLPKFLDAGISISINSDDPPFVKTTIGQEYSRVQEVYKFDDNTMNRISTMAIDAAFVDNDTKEKLKHELLDG